MQVGCKAWAFRETGASQRWIWAWGVYLGEMGTAALADLSGKSQPSRRERAAKTVDTALRGGILTGAVAAIAWLLAVAIGSTVFLLLVVATVLALIYTVARGDK